MELLMRKSGRSWVPLWLNQTSEWDDQRHWFFQLQKISTEEDICKWWRLQQASLGWSPHLSWHNRLGHQHPPEAKPCKVDKSLKQEFRRWHKRMKKKKVPVLFMHTCWRSIGGLLNLLSGVSKPLVGEELTCSCQKRPTQTTAKWKDSKILYIFWRVYLTLILFSSFKWWPFSSACK